MAELISVVVPVYNAEQFLKPCIQSILDQTHTNIELLLVDDGSTDSSAEICKEFATADSRVCFLQPPHAGVSAARNTGIRQAKGDYICFVDSDDALEPDFIQVLYAELEKKEVQIVFCNHQYLYGDKKLKRNSRIRAGKYTFQDISHFAIDDGTVTGILFGSVCGAMYRMDAIKEYGVSFDPTIKRNEDGLFNLCLLKDISAFSVTDYDGYLYRQWKKRKRKDFVVDVEVGKATEKIKECCADYADLDKQLRCRNVSAVFWNAGSIAGTSRNFFATCSFLKNFLAEHPIEEDFKSLNFQKMNRFKKILIPMLKKKQVFLFVFSLKYLYPILQRVIKR